MTAQPETEADIPTLQETLITRLQEKGDLHDPRVAAALRAVPRHLFLPGAPVERVYDDVVIPTKIENGRAISSSSQPAIMTIMLEQLQPQRGEHILEIGAGTGFNAALIAHMVGPEGRVTAVDIEPDLIARAEKHLHAAGVENVHLHCGDGAAGYAANGPYDRIILTVAAPDILPAWLEQLQPHGRILLPLTFHGPQLSIAFDRRGDQLVSHSIAGCGFIPLRGGSGDPIHFIKLAGLSHAFVITYDGALTGTPQINETLAGWLQGPTVDLPAELGTGRWELFSGWRLWHVLQGEHAAAIDAQLSDDVALVPFLYGANTEKPFRATIGIINSKGMALFMRPPDQKPPTLHPDPQARAPFPLYVRGFGPQAADVARDLIANARQWDAAGRPAEENLRIIAVPRGQAPPTVPPNTLVLNKEWRHYLFSWPAAENENSRRP